MKPTAVPLLLALMISALLFNNCAPKQYVTRNGQQIPLAQAVNSDATKVRETMRSGKKKEALQLWNKFLLAYPNNRYSAEALFTIAKNHFDKKNCKAAEQQLNKIISDFPQSNYSNPAKVLLGYCFAKSSLFDASYSLLASSKKRGLSLALQKLLFATQRKNAAILDQPLVLAKSDGSLYNLLTDNKKRSLLYRETDNLIRRRLSAQQLNQLVNHFQDKFPADLALLQLAELSYQQRQLREAIGYLKQFKRNFREHQKSFEVLALIEEIEEQKRVESNKIGVLLPLSGKNATYGQRLVEGIQYAAGTFNKGLALGDKVEFIVRDTEDNPTLTVRALNELVLREHVLAILGPLFPQASDAAAKRAERLGVPLITFSQIENIAASSPYIFRNSITKSRQAASIVKTAVDVLGINDFAILFPDHAYGQEFAQLFYQQLLQYPQTRLVAAASYPSGKQDFSRQIKRISARYPLRFRKEEICKLRRPKDYIDDKQICYKASELPAIVDFQAIFIPDNLSALNQIAPSLFYYDITGIQLLGTNLWNSDKIFKANNQRYFQGAIFPALFLQGKKLEPFRKDFMRQFGSEPDIFHVLAIDSTRLLLKAMSAPAGARRESLAKIMADPGFSVEGVSGPFAFNRQGEATNDLTMLIVDGKNIRVIGESENN